MKPLVAVALALALGLMFFFYRRRLKLAIMVAGSLYLLITLVRLIVLREDLDRLTLLALALGGLGAVWLATNLVTSLIQRRRQREARR